MGNLRPETDAPTLADVLAMLLRVESKEELEAVYDTIHFDEIATTDEEKSALVTAVISAAARCWARRWPTGGE